MSGNFPVEFPLKSAKDGIQKNIPRSLHEIVPKDENKVKEKFAGKRHKKFPSYRCITLESVMEYRCLKRAAYLADCNSKPHQKFSWYLIDDATQ